MSIYNSLYQMSVRLRQPGTGKKVYDFLENAGVRIAVSRFFNWRTVCHERVNPTQRILDSRAFFAENAERVDYVESLLADQESKRVFRAMVNFRCSSEYSDLPANSMRTQYFEICSCPIQI